MAMCKVREERKVYQLKKVLSAQKGFISSLSGYRNMSSFKVSGKKPPKTKQQTTKEFEMKSIKEVVQSLEYTKIIIKITVTFCFFPKK